MSVETALQLLGRVISKKPPCWSDLEQISQSVLAPARLLCSSTSPHLWPSCRTTLYCSPSAEYTESSPFLFQHQGKIVAVYKMMLCSVMDVCWAVCFWNVTQLNFLPNTVYLLPGLVVWLKGIRYVCYHYHKVRLFGALGSLYFCDWLFLSPIRSHKVLMAKDQCAKCFHYIQKTIATFGKKKKMA